MFHMVSEFGNAHRDVPTERRRDELIAQGWRVVEDKPKPPRKKAGKREGDAE